MAYEEALDVVNGINDGLASLARDIARALRDGKVRPMEGMALGMKGMSFASAMVLAFQKANRDEVLHVLEHGRWVLEE